MQYFVRIEIQKVKKVLNLKNVNRAKALASSFLTITSRLNLSAFLVKNLAFGKMHLEILIRKIEFGKKQFKNIVKCEAKDSKK